MDREAELRADYTVLGEKLVEAEGSAAAAIVRERRLISAELQLIGKPKETSVVDRMAEQRAKRSAGGPSARRRKSG